MSLARKLTPLLTSSLLCLALSAPAYAQAGGDEPTVVAPTNGAVPGRLTRPSSRPDPEPTAAPSGEADPEAPTAPAAAGAPTAPAGPTPTAPSAPAASPPERTGPVARPSAPVLDPAQVAPDVGEIRENFEEGFDPLDPPANVRVNIDFREAELQDVVMWISALTGRNFIIADTINASKKITIISPQPVSIAEAYRAFLAALNMNGLTVVPFGRFLKIVEAAGAERQVLTPSESAGQIPDDDRMVTHIHQLAHVSISTVQPVLDALKTSTASIVAYEPTNTLIITETGSNLRRLLDILETLDVPSGQDQINIYQVRYAAAEALKSLLLEVFGDEGNQNAPAPEPVRRTRRRSEETADPAPAAATDTSVSSVSVSQIISDERTNQLIIIANQRSYERILDLVAQLDVPIPGEGQVHVLFLENADATELASTLQSLTQSVQDMRPDQNPTLSQAATEASASTATFSGDLSITADEATNALVVVASLRDFLALRSVIEQLDRRRQQVYVEAVVMEVTLNRQNQAGLVWHTGAPGPSVDGNDSLLFGATSVGGLSSLSIDPSSLLGLTVGLQGPSLADLFNIDSPLLSGLPSIGAVLQAAQTDNNVNILSTPHILTMDNEEAEIVVGENIPFISGINSGLGSLGSLASSLGGGDLSSLGNLSSLGSSLGGLGGLGGVSVQRQDVALTLRITPQINESNYVRLEIEEEVEDVQSIDPVLGPRTTTRQARTTVVVQDQQTIVIGGLMRDTQSEDISKVPFLGDIPLIGRLFRHTTTRNAKTNLLLLLTPYIIRDSSDFQEIFRRKMEEREEFMSYFGRRDAEFVAAVDYARKDGPMQSVFESIRTAIEEEEARQRAFGPATEESPISAPATAPVRVDFGAEAPLLSPSDATAP
ncbi:MAG: type II secretion system secretin GspD [Myxococcales bacterium]|nr:type II secretion system secretin GspD [Myxococcales bacterium]